MHFASLGSGSEGNALIVQVGATCAMLDCGFGIAETVARLARLELLPNDLAGIVVTHEHSDHIGGVARFARRYDIPVWLTRGTLSALRPNELPPHLARRIDSHTPFSIGDIQVHPFPVPHDAREPVQFVFSDGARRLGVLTDTGTSTPHVESCLSGVDALVLECNHDLELLLNGPYPPSLKQRVSGRHGHMDNHTAAALLAKLDTSRLQHLVAAHLSRKNNRASLAQAALSGVLNCSQEWIGIADQDTGFAWREVT